MSTIIERLAWVLLFLLALVLLFLASQERVWAQQLRYAPRSIYNHGQYYLCAVDDPTPECDMPNDYSAALHPYRGPPDPVQETPTPTPRLLVPGLPPNVEALANKAIRNALRPKYQPPPAMTMEQEREYIIRQGEAHCRRFPQDTAVCHAPR